MAHTDDVQTAVREKYGELARSVGTAGGCGPAACGCGDPITSNLYSDQETKDLPADAVAASLGCGNPTALLALEPGQIVLDLGSGGGIDVLLSAKRVGPTGKAYGLDMTDDMLALARRNQQQLLGGPHDIVAIELHAAPHRQPARVDGTLPCGQVAWILAVGVADMTDRADAETDQVGVRMRGVTHEIAMQAALLLCLGEVGLV